MKIYKIDIVSIGKTFNRRTIFTDVSFSMMRNESVAIVGRNGSGKSTLCKIIAGLLTPTSGAVTIEMDSGSLRHDRFFRYLGYVSPYINMYEEFTGIENLKIQAKIRAEGKFDNDYATALMRRLNIVDRKNDDVRTYSSGMKQRLKYAAALLHRPQILIVDEPTSNLDEEGSRTVRTILEEQRTGGMVIIATNEPNELALASKIVSLQ
jgi:heme exporter protein A